MSKNKSKKTKVRNKGNKKNKNSIINTIKTFSIILAIVLVVIGVCLIYNITNPPSGLENTMWKSVSAFDASDDEVDIYEVYNNNYSSYQGSMTFKSDNNFTFWMSAGDPDDGSHSGKYSYVAKNDTIKAVFDNGDEAEFKIIRNEDRVIKRIEVPYGDYTIYFVAK